MSVLVWTGDHSKSSAERLRLMNSLAVDVPIDSKIYNAQPQRGLVSLRLAYDNKDKALNQSTNNTDPDSGRRLRMGKTAGFHPRNDGWNDVVLD